MDYRVYRLSAKEIMVVLLKAVGITGCIAILFYESMWGAALFPVICTALWKRSVREGKEQRLQGLSVQFLDAMRAVSAALLGGYSVENALLEAQKEVALLHGDASDMYRELAEINRSVQLGVPVEKLFAEFGARSGVEDISGFAEVFAFAKRSGGDLVKIIETTTEHMRLKQETEQEITVAVAARKLEQKVMNVVPLFLLAYLRVSSGDYLDVMYGNLSGVLVMTGCLLGYAASIYLSERLLAIRV
jgi:tight adherence protein B